MLCRQAALTGLFLLLGGAQGFVAPSAQRTSASAFGVNTLNTRSPGVASPLLSTTALQATAAFKTGSSIATTKPKGAKNDWEVHKFGGASLATPELYVTVGDLLMDEAAGRGAGSIPTMAIVSARGGMTDLLVDVVDSALQDFDAAQQALDKAVESQIALLRELAPPDITDPVEARFRQDAKDILSVVQSLRMINTVPAVTMEVVTGFGEIWSAQTLHAYLQTKTNVPSAWIDARDVLVVNSNNAGLGEKGEASTGGVSPVWDQTEARMTNWWNTVGKEEGITSVTADGVAPIVVVTGFVATTSEGVPTTLKRSGSDYSATLFAKLVGAGRVTMWKNTNGVYTADPRRVPEAFPIASLKYDEAMELAYFGAQVLHPSAMEPCIDDQIPVYVRNIFNPAFEGTVIEGRSATLQEVNEGGSVTNWRSNKGVIPIKGITSVDKIALVTLEGASVVGGGKAAERFMGAMANAGINVLIITQASSESSICVAVPENQGQMALRAVQGAFELELERSAINSVSLVPGMSIVAIVGEGMAMSSGVSATFMSSLAKANVNIRVIAQGSSERQVAVVVDGTDTSRALRAAHMAFTLSETAVSVTLLGSTGQVGSALIAQLNRQKEFLAESLGVDMRLNIACSSSKITFCKNSQGLDIAKVNELLNNAEDCEISGDADCEEFDLEKVTEVMKTDVNPHRVLVDCTNSEDICQYYEGWLNEGINVISPNRKVSAGPMEKYNQVKEAQRKNAVDWLYESGVGAALPVVSTLRDLLESGDEVHVIQGAISGTMAYVFNTMSDDVSFSDALSQAANQDYSEADLLEDLTGLDAARKVVILARQLGLNVNIEDVEVDSLVPDKMAKKKYPEGRDERNEAILKDVKEFVDDDMMERFQTAKAEDRVLRYKFVIDNATGKCSCKLDAVGRDNALFRLKANENLVAFETERYTTSPLIVKGAAAGPDLAAAGIFADLLRLTRTLTSVQI